MRRLQLPGKFTALISGSNRQLVPSEHDLRQVERKGGKEEESSPP